MTLADRAKSAGANVLIIDIERLPGLARVWEPKTRYVPITQFTKLPSLLCFAAKWYGQRTVEFHAGWDNHDQMVAKAWELYDKADIVVTYNGLSFDNRHLKSDWLVAGMPPPKPWKDVDLYRVNRTHFGFESKSLNHLCYRLGLDTKSGHYDAVTAEQAMAGDQAAQRRMKRYNVGDVKITEQAYDRLRPWISNHPFMGELPTNDTRKCNACSSTNLVRNGTYRAVAIDYVLYRCADCGANVRGGSHSRAAATRGVR